MTIQIVGHVKLLWNVYDYEHFKYSPGRCPSRLNLCPYYWISRYLTIWRTMCTLRLNLCPYYWISRYLTIRLTVCSLRLNLCPHYFISRCLTLWLARCPLRLNLCPQCLHWNGFSPVWIRRWVLNCDWYLNVRPQ